MIQQQAVPVETLSTGQVIPPAQWARFQHISQEHRGEHATLELRDPDSAVPTAVHYQRFRTIAAVEDNGMDRITIVTENQSGNAIMYTIPKPARVQFADALRSTLSMLTIGTISGTVAVLRFSQVETPEQ